MSLIKDGKVYRTIEEQVAWLTKIKYNSYQKEEVNEIVKTLNQEIDTKAEKQEVNQTVEILNQKINTKQNKLNFDITPTVNSTNPVTSGGVYNAIETEKQEVNSTVSNLEQQINTKQDKLIFDTSPTINSTNPVTSGGVYNAIKEIENNSFDIPSLSQLAEWNENNLSTSLIYCSGLITKSVFKIGRKGDTISITGRFLIYVESRLSDNPGLQIKLPNSWNISSTVICSYGDCFVVGSPYDNSQIESTRPYLIETDANSNSISIRLTETYSNILTGKFYSFQVPLTYIKL